MAVTANRSTVVVFAGDTVGTQTHEAAENIASPGAIWNAQLASGNNSIAVPAGGAVCTAVTIIPPEGNTVALTLKGVNGDTGIRLHLTDPSVIAVDTSVVAFVLYAANSLNGVRLIWS